MRQEDERDVEMHDSGVSYVHRLRQASPAGSRERRAYSDVDASEDTPLGPQIKVHHPDDSDESSKSLPGDAQTPAESQTSEDLNLVRRESLDFDHQRPRSYSSADGFVVPQTITYSLHLTFENSVVHDVTPHRIILLNDPNSYREIEEIAERHVRNQCAAALASKELNFRNGKCTVVGDEDYKDSQALISLDDWKDICTVLINLWTSDYHRTLHLDIFREYYALQTKVVGTANFANTKRKEIHSLMHRALDDRRYIPRTDLLRVTSKDMIRQIIIEDPLTFERSDEREAFIQRVQQKASRLLAMCVYANLPMRCLGKLLENGLDDDKHPLQDGDCCHPDCEIEFHTMVQQQGAFRAAEFWHIGEHQRFDPHTVLPMAFHPKLQDGLDPLPEEMENESEEEEIRDNQDNSAKRKAYCGSGAYSNVYRVRIDANHHRLSRDRDSIFAVKEFKDRPQKRGADFQQELNFLNELRKYPHPHIVTHLATWTQGEVYCMLFPYAQCNLRQYMRRVKLDRSDTGSTTWFLDQLRSLADALREIHNLQTTGGPASTDNLIAPGPKMQKSGWHHDIKPENILFFRDRRSRYGKLCIADFGSGKVHTYRSGSINTKSANGTLTYEPPEAQSEGRTSRPYDVFSLGCVFLELLIWAVCDYRSVRTFTSERVARRSPGSQFDFVEDDGFWQRTEAGTVTIRKSVIDWISQLKQMEHHYDQVLDLIMHMLEPDKSKRITAVILWNSLDKIYNMKKVDLDTSMDGSFPKFKESLQPAARASFNLPSRRVLEPNFPSPNSQYQPRRKSNAAPLGRFYLDTQNLTTSPLERSPILAPDQHRRNSSASDTHMLSANSRTRNLSISSSMGHFGSSINSGPRSPDLPEETSELSNAAL